MNKKFAAVIVLTFVMTLTNCSSPEARAVQFNTVQVSQTKSFVETVKNLKIKKDNAAKEFARYAELNSNTKKVNWVIKKLKKRVGKTWYVFSGSTPSGWDCSGLTMWAYKQLGIDIPHSATKQKYSGKRVKSPKPGDLVVFGWRGSKNAEHVGIYIGNGKMIHAGNHKGERTEIISVDKRAKIGNNKVFYIRLIDTK